MSYAVLNSDKTAVVRVLSELPGSFRPGYVLPVVEDVEPAFDPATQKAVRVWIIEAAQVLRGWEVVALSAEELDSRSRDAKKQLVSQAIPTLRQWATQLSAVTVTSGNAVATLQALIDRQEIFYDRFADLLEAQRIDK